MQIHLYRSCLGWGWRGLAQLWCFHHLWCSTAVFISHSEQILRLWSVAYAELYFHPLLLTWTARKSFLFINGECNCHLILKSSKPNMESISVDTIGSWKNTFSMQCGLVNQFTLQEVKRRVQMISQRLTNPCISKEELVEPINSSSFLTCYHSPQHALVGTVFFWVENQFFFSVCVLKFPLKPLH